MRITVHIKGDYERAVRLVVDPKTDTWDGFVKDMLKALKLTPASFTIQRASTKSVITALDQIRLVILETLHVVCSRTTAWEKGGWRD